MCEKQGISPLVGDIPVRTVIFLSEQWFTTEYHMFGRIRRNRPLLPPLFIRFYTLFSVIPVKKVCQPCLFPLCNGEKRAERWETHEEQQFSPFWQLLPNPALNQGVINTSWSGINCPRGVKRVEKWCLFSPRMWGLGLFFKWGSEPIALLRCQYSELSRA